MSTGPQDHDRDDARAPQDTAVPSDAPVDTGTGPNEAEPVPEDTGDDEERFDAG